MRIDPQRTGYILAVAACFAVAQLGAWTAFGTRIDNDAYDFFYRLSPPDRAPTSVILAIDDRSLQEHGGVRGLRRMLAEALERLAEAGPRAVAVDLILADEGDHAEDIRLAEALRRIERPVLAAELRPEGANWEKPQSSFRQPHVAIGHVHASPDETDMIIRQVPLEKKSREPERLWAMSLEMYRAVEGRPEVLEMPRALEIGSLYVPADVRDGRPLYVRYLTGEGAGDPATRVPRVALRDWLAGTVDPARFHGAAVFVGVTAQSAMSDRWMTPVSVAGAPMPGVEIHANAFETLRSGEFLTDAGPLMELAVSAMFALAAGLVFAYSSGVRAYLAAGALLVGAHIVPFLFFRSGVVFSWLSVVGSAWLPVAGAAAWQHFVVRKQLGLERQEKTRYQQAVHFVTHELRTPLTAIQGSSELMTRYNLPEGKRNELAHMITSESRRLAQMIETFLNVERLSAGQIDLRKGQVPVKDVVEACLGRAAKLADRKQIRLRVGALNGEQILADRELIEYALYNLVTNAIKYSPPETEVRLEVSREEDLVRVTVADQGMGMDQKELGQIFQRFYRTRRAEKSGEAGTGIGLSLVQQIVASHGGKVEVQSTPGRGSRFSLLLPCSG